MTQLSLIVAVAASVCLAVSAVPTRHAASRTAAVAARLADACGTTPFCTDDDGVHRGIVAPRVNNSMSLAVACGDPTDPFCGDDGVHRGVAAPAVHRGVALAVACPDGLPVCTGDDGVHRGLAALQPARASLAPHAMSLAVACPADLPVCTGDDGVHRG